MDIEEIFDRGILVKCTPLSDEWLEKLAAKIEQQIISIDEEEQLVKILQESGNFCC